MVQQEKIVCFHWLIAQFYPTDVTVTSLFQYYKILDYKLGAILS